MSQPTTPQPSPQQKPNQPYVPTFGPTQYQSNIYSLDRRTVLPVQVEARIDKGFFIADGQWTCYRRNYFQVHSSYTLHGIGVVYDGQDLPCLVQRDQDLVPVSGFSVGVRARVAHDNGKDVPLVQHTPKRDKGPQTTPQPIPVRPQHESATFDRLQFRSATANNGKRRAAQQYYMLIVELYAQTSHGIVPVASVESCPLVVRGRSPGHYAEADAQQSPPEEQLVHLPPPNTFVDMEQPYSRTQNYAASAVSTVSAYPQPSPVVSPPLLPHPGPPPSGLEYHPSHSQHQQQQQQQQQQGHHARIPSSSSSSAGDAYSYGRYPPALDPLAGRMRMLSDQSSLSEASYSYPYPQQPQAYYDTNPSDIPTSTYHHWQPAPLQDPPSPPNNTHKRTQLTRDSNPDQREPRKSRRTS